MRIALMLLAAAPLAAEVHTLTLAQAVDRALAGNPELVIARLDEQAAAAEVRVARDPFIPKVFVGSGLAYSSGFPLSIDGAAPSVMQAQGRASIVNRPLRHELARQKEEARGAALSTEATRDGIVARTAELYLDAEFAARKAEAAAGQVASLERVAQAIRLRIEEGRELPIEARRAELDVALAGQRAEQLEAAQEIAERSLASVLGFGHSDRVRAAGEERMPVDLPASAEEAVAAALEDHPRLRRLESSVAAERLRVKAARGERLPRVNLLAQYALLARFNNYDRFFSDFQRHNGQIGVAVEVPLYAGPAAGARVAQANTAITRLQAELTSTRNRIALDARRDHQEVKAAETAATVARMDLDLARENLSVILARLDEGRAAVRDVEAARYVENEKWIAFYESRRALEVARYRLLGRTGGLLAAVGRPLGPRLAPGQP